MIKNIGGLEVIAASTAAVPKLAEVSRLADSGASPDIVMAKVAFLGLDVVKKN